MRAKGFAPLTAGDDADQAIASMMDITVTTRTTWYLLHGVF
jgi:hypothetical protein